LGIKRRSMSDEDDSVMEACRGGVLWLDVGGAVGDGKSCARSTVL
jgi:hypothetical protein